MKSRIVAFLLVLIALLTACAPDTSLKADNGKAYQDVPEDVRAMVKDTTIVHLAIRVVNEQITAQYQAAPAEGSATRYDTYGSASFTGQIIEGKGIMLVEIINGPSQYMGTAILKFVDLKAMALQPGFIAQVSCVVDYELLNPSENTTYTGEALTYELDDCRLNTPMVTTNEG